MQFDAELLLLAMALVFLACTDWEALHFAGTRRPPRLYNGPDALCTAAVTLMHRGTDKLPRLAVVRHAYHHAYHPAYHRLTATFHERRSVFADALRAPCSGDLLRAIFGPPEWATAYHAAHAQYRLHHGHAAYTRR